MTKKGKNMPGYVVRNSRYMKRHLEEEKIISQITKRKQQQETFRDFREK